MALTCQLLKVRVVKNKVNLLSKLLVNLGDDCRNRLDYVVANKLSLRQRLCCQRAHSLLDGALRFLSLGLKLFLQQSCKLNTLSR